MAQDHLHSPEKSIADSSQEISLIVNGREVTQAVAPRTHLGDFLRQQLNLTGTHLGCEHGVCGACVVLLDGQPVRSCITYAVACDGHRITTIEGFDDDPVMEYLRAAFTQHHALQCGYCTPGMITTARDIVLRLPEADEKTVRAELSGNLCRCTGYMGIVQAVLSVLERLKQEPDAAVEVLRQAAKEANLAKADPTPKLSTGSRFEQITEQVSFEPRPISSTVKTASQSNPSSGTLVEQVFDIPFAPDRVWQFMIDLPSVARCLPGAEVLEQDGDQVRGRVVVKFGPMRASFEGRASLEVETDQRQATLVGVGEDRLSNSRANGRVTYQVVASENQSSTVHVNMTYALQGPLAQFSRSGIVQDFIARMVQDFANNITHALRNDGSTETLPTKGVNPVTMLFQILLDRLRRIFFGRK